MNKWTNVKDNFPEEETEVLVYKGNFIGGLMDVYLYLGDDIWQDSYGQINMTCKEGITHWMPLPEKPKEEV